MLPLELLSETPLFSGCSKEALDRLGEIAETREFRPEELLFSLGDEARSVLVIASGTVQLELPVTVLGQSRSIAFETEGRGATVGWSALTSDRRFTLTGRAVGATKALSFFREDLEALFAIDPACGRQVFRNALSIVRTRLERTQSLWIREVELGVEQRFRS